MNVDVMFPISFSIVAVLSLSADYQCKNISDEINFVKTVAHEYQ
jgi:hypothetical protein